MAGVLTKPDGAHNSHPGINRGVFLRTERRIKPILSAECRITAYGVERQGWKKARQDQRITAAPVENIGAKFFCLGRIA